MEKYLKLFAIAMATLPLLLSCKKDDHIEPTPIPVEVSFTFDISDVSKTNATIVITPSDSSAAYCAGIFVKESFDSVAFSSQAAGLDSYNGVETFKPEDLIPSTEYIAAAFGYKDGKCGKVYISDTFRTDDEDEPEPPTPGEPEINTIVINGDVLQVKKVFVEDYAGYMMLTATTDENAESFEWLVDNDGEYFTALVIPSLFGETFDIMTTEDPFTFMSTFQNAIIEGISNDYKDNVESGKARFTYQDNTATVYFTATLSDGTTFSILTEGTYTEKPVSENVITRNGEKKPLRAAFYLCEEDTYALYFTPAQIDYFAEIESATYYFCIMGGPEIFTSETIDITNTSASFMLMLVDNYTEDFYIFDSSESDGTTGTIKLTQNSLTDYEAEVDITFVSGETLSLSFEGTCRDVYEEAPQNNSFIYLGEEIFINSAIVDRRSDIWVVYLSNQEGITDPSQMTDPLIITMPSELFDGDNHGFSFVEELSIEYKGKLYNHANGDSGTISASLSNNNLTITFTDYNDINGYFNGEAQLLD